MEYKIKVYSTHAGTAFASEKNKYRGVIRIDEGAEHTTDDLYPSDKEAVVAALSVLVKKIPTLVNFINDIGD